MRRALALESAFVGIVVGLVACSTDEGVTESARATTSHQQSAS